MMNHEFKNCQETERCFIITPKIKFGNTTYGVRIRSSPRNICVNLAFISQSEHKNFKEAEYDKNWISVTMMNLVNLK